MTTVQFESTDTTTCLFTHVSITTRIIDNVTLSRGIVRARTHNIRGTEREQSIGSHEAIQATLKY